MVYDFYNLISYTSDKAIFNIVYYKLVNKIKPRMKLLKKSTKMTDTSEYSNTMSRISQRNKFFYSDHNNSRFNAVGNKTYDH